jgi:hypothetical protein
LFQGRYKAVLVEGGDDSYFGTVSDYIHLNPARARMLGEERMLVDYPWSSFPALVGDPRKRPGWLCGDWVLGRWGGKDNARGRRAYREALERRAAEEQDAGASNQGMLKALRRGWCFGSEEFRQRTLELMASGAKKPSGAIRAAHNEQEAERLVAAGLEAVGLAVGDLAQAAKSDPRKIAVAAVVKSRTIVGNEWIARRLSMGAAGRVSRYCSEAALRPEVQRLMNQITSKGKA